MSYPGDVVSGATGFWSLRAYTDAIAAAATQPLINVRRSSDDATTDVLVATNGGLGVTQGATSGPNGVSLSTWGGADNLFVTRIYDQTGGGSSNDILQSTAAFQPPLFLTGGPASDKPYMAFSNSGGSAVTLQRAAANYVTSVHMSATAVFNSTSVFDGMPFSISGGSANVQIRVNFSNGAADGIVYNLTILHYTYTNNAWHRANVAYNGASSDISIDAVHTTGDTGAGSAASDNTLFMGIGLNASYTAQMVEMGVWDNIVFSTTQLNNMDANQNAYWFTAGAVTSDNILMGAIAF